MTQNVDTLHRFVAVESELASYLKTLDKNHLVSISYMPLGTQDNEPLFETCVQAQGVDVIEVVANPVITCGVKNGNLFDNLGNVYLRTDDRIEVFNRLCLNYGKVYWLSDACYPRDAFFVRPSSRTDARNAYFAYLLSKVEEAKRTGQPLVGCSFKGWGGMASLMREKELVRLHRPPPVMATLASMVVFFSKRVISASGAHRLASMAAK